MARPGTLRRPLLAALAVTVAVSGVTGATFAARAVVLATFANPIDVPPADTIVIGSAPDIVEIPTPTHTPAPTPAATPTTSAAPTPPASSTTTTPAPTTTTTTPAPTTTTLAPIDGVPTLDNPFAGPLGEWVGGDLPHVYPLADGSELWWLNDSFLTPDGTGPVSPRDMVRNVAFLRRPDGSMAMLAGGRPSRRSETLPHPTVRDRFARFMWPLGGVQDANLLKVIVAEMRVDVPQWAISFYPVQAWLATYDLTSLALVDLRPAPNPGVRPLYGFSITNDDTWTYLYGSGHRYNDPDAAGVLDGRIPTDQIPGGSRTTYVARVPLGKIDQPPAYWDGTGWNPDPATAVPILTRGLIDFRMSVTRTNNGYIGVAKEDEFLGDTLSVLRADQPEGPFVEIARIPATTDVHAGVTYDAVPYPKPVGCTPTPPGCTGGTLAILYSVNTRDERHVFRNPHVYRPALIVTDIPF